MNESTIPDNEFLFNKVKDLESMATPEPVVHEGTGETHFGGAMDYSDFAFGFSISGAVVTVNAGYIFHGESFAQAFQTDITIEADLTYIYVEYIIGNSSATIKSQQVLPACTVTILNLPLHLWGVNSGVVSLESRGIHHLGDFIIPGIFA